jgi:hypothetical protein
MLRESFIGERIELSGRRVSFDLPIPPGVIVFDEPLTQPREGLVVKALDLLLDLAARLGQVRFLLDFREGMFPSEFIAGV